MQVSKQLVEMMHLICRAFEREADEELIGRVRVYVESPHANLHSDAQALVGRTSKQLQAALDGFDKAEDKVEWYDYLAASYSELFLGVAEKPIAPFESVYLSKEKTLYEREYFEVHSFMSGCGFSKPKNFYEPEDHLAMEWGFLAYMLDQAALEREEGNAAKANELDAFASQFIKEHLVLWNDAACDDFIKSDDSNGFYSGFANLAKAVMAELKLGID